MPAPINKAKQVKYSNIITDFLKERVIISINTLEKKLSLPFTTIAKPLGNPDAFIPEKHIYTILTELVNYGLEIDGYKGLYDEHTDTIIFKKWIENISTEGNEHNFTYIERYKTYFICSYLDLL